MTAKTPPFATLPFEENVREFHLRMGHPVAIEPDPAQLLFRARLITEEAAEFVAAASSNNRAEMIDALCDLLYVTFGTGVVLGVDLSLPFAKVHAKNMTKIPSGSATEKPQKPAGFIPPQNEE